ncbi:MAG: type I methionyl aminopeptidase [Candidatus Omnitrophota bacterium]
MVPIKTPVEIEILRKAGRILSLVLKEVSSSVKAGMRTADIDLLTEELIRKNGCIAAFKGYRGYPASACVSVNQEVVHGIPGDRIIKTGDIVSIDAGLIYQNYYADAALTVTIDPVDPAVKKLVDVTREALNKGIAQAKAGVHLSNISHAIQIYAEAHECSVVRDFVGHGIGRQLHEEPEILNYGPANCGPVLQEGMVFCIEPMLNMGDWQTKILDDGWTVETLDGKPSAHFEHMILIQKGAAEVLTKF